ncbi:MAG: quinolinate synthetase, partial [Acidobacteria bacterium]|nr:quinolinate synthetase [Acidobacteriota bacterium]
MSSVLEAVRPFEDYLTMPDEEIHERIEAAREELGSRVVVLGHHYQRDDVIEHADLTGDSYQLSVMASQRKEAEYIVFC